jgi:hypothetical protein
VTDVVLFHHIQGLTPGVVEFADRLRAAGQATAVLAERLLAFLDRVWAAAPTTATTTIARGQS